MPTAEVLLAQIAARTRGGTYDESLDELINGILSIQDAVKARRRTLARAAIRTIEPGKVYRIINMPRTKGMNGLLVLVLEVKRTRVVVQMPEKAPRFAGQRVVLQATCLEPIDSEEES